MKKYTKVPNKNLRIAQKLQKYQNSENHNKQKSRTSAYFMVVEKNSEVLQNGAIEI